MHTTIRLPRPGRPPNRRDPQAVPVPAGWYEHAQAEMFASFGIVARYFCPKQIGQLDGWCGDEDKGGVVLFVRVALAVRDEEL